MTETPDQNPAGSTPDEPDSGVSLDVGSAVLPSGTYGVQVSAGPDRAFVLDRHRALEYAAVCADRATTAAHDAAVMSLLTGPMRGDRPGLPFDTVAQFIALDLRARRSSDTDTFTRPLRFIPQLGARTRLPFIDVHLDDSSIGQISVDQLAEHALGVLMSLAAAGLDDTLRRSLVSSVGLKGDTALAVVGDLSNHLGKFFRPESHPPVD